MRLQLLPLLSFLTLLPVVVVALSPFSSSAPSAMTFCKCMCFSNSTILPLYLPKDPLHPCLSCTRQFCLDQKLPSCIGATAADEDLDVSSGVGGDVEARCFQRDSPKSHFIVVSFIIVTSGLLVGAGLKQYAGIDLQELWNRNGFRGILSELIDLSQRIFSRSRPRNYAAMGRG
ncbi:hypothetical protein T439DRAFT_330272 [Meredithblackwellia eburnea MCA 4105]